MNKRVHVYIEGLVQGVFFRWETKQTAEKIGIYGWVKNLPDGRVEAVFEGKKEDVDKMVDWCRKGPPAAVVKNVEVIEEEYTGEFKDFKIKY